MKITVGVMACTSKKNYIDEIIYCLDTWVPDLVKEGCNVFFFTGDKSLDTHTFDYPNVIHLPKIGDDQISATDKQWLGYKYLYENDPSDFYCLVGTDNYVRLDKLKLMLEKYDKTKDFCISGYIQTRYFGRKCITFPFGGSGIILTHSALAKMIPDIENFKNQWISYCESVNPFEKGSCDVALAYFIEKYKIPLVRDYDVYPSNWLYFFKDNLIIDIGHMDHQNMAICHYMGKRDFYLYHRYKDSVEAIESYRFLIEYCNRYFMPGYYENGFKNCHVLIFDLKDEIIMNTLKGMIDSLNSNLKIFMKEEIINQKIIETIKNLGVELIIE